MTDPKVIARIEKLLRLAAPSSHSTEAERASAALEASRLIDENGLTFTELRAPRHHSRKATWGIWVPWVALHHAGCAGCHNQISPGDTVWMKILQPGQQVVRHNYPPCNQDLERK